MLLNEHFILLSSPGYTSIGIEKKRRENTGFLATTFITWRAIVKRSLNSGGRTPVCTHTVMAVTPSYSKGKTHGVEPEAAYCAGGAIKTIENEIQIGARVRYTIGSH